MRKRTRLEQWRCAPSLTSSNEESSKWCGDIFHKPSSDESVIEGNRIARLSEAGYLRLVQKRNPRRAITQRLSDWFSAAGSPVRLKLLVHLEHDELAVPRLAEIVGTSRGMVTRQLSLLRAAGLVRMVRQGRRVRYRATSTGAARRFLKLVIDFAIDANRT